MTTIHIMLTDELKAKLEQHAAEHGQRSIEQYVDLLIRESTQQDEDFGAPSEQTLRGGATLESLIRQGIDSGPAQEVTDAEWEQVRRDTVQRHSVNKGR